MKKLPIILMYLFYSTISYAQSINELPRQLNHVYNSNKSSKIYFTNSDSIFEYQNGKVNFIKKVFNLETVKGSKLIVVKNEFFFIDNLGGAVYKENQNLLKRIDHSFKHKNQLAAAVFTYNDTIYKFGGYGFFGARNFMTYFSESSKEWEVVVEAPKSEHPPGLFEMKHFVFEDNLYVFGGSTINLSNRNESISNKEIWRFSFKEKIWKKIGELNLEKLYYHIFDFTDTDKFYFNHGSTLYRLDLDQFSLIEYDENDLLKKINYAFPGTIQNNQLNVLVNTFNSEKQISNIMSIDLNDLDFKQKHLLSKEYEINTEYIYALIIAILIISLYVFFKKFSYLKIKNKSIQFRFNRIQLNENEINFMNLLLNETLVENSKFLELLPNTIEISHKSRVKNATIEDLNSKLRIISGKRFIIKKIRSKEDRRYYNYKLIKK